MDFFGQQARARASTQRLVCLFGLALGLTNLAIYFALAGVFQFTRQLNALGILGYAHDKVNAAVAAQIARGHSFSLPHPVEVRLAERLQRLVPCAEMVRFGKNGSDATAGAVRVARAFTGRERIACCGYHGWQDWYIGSTTRHRGVPGAVRALTYPFPYNDLPALANLLAQHNGEFAAVIMEPVNFTMPAPGYLQGSKTSRTSTGHC